MTKMICFGDSNTWGFDPRSYIAEQYEDRWTAIMDRISGIETENHGINGLGIPVEENQVRYIRELILKRAAEGPLIFTLMLGTNELLSGSRAPAVSAGGRMDRLLSGLLEEGGEGEKSLKNKVSAGIVRFILITSPNIHEGTWIDDKNVIDEVPKYAALCLDLAKKYGIECVDTHDWPIETATDGVHFTEEGHRVFASKLKQALGL